MSIDDQIDGRLIMYDKGQVVAHSSDDGGQPDVGLSVGIGNGLMLYAGEVSGADGPAIKIYSETKGESFYVANCNGFGEGREDAYRMIEAIGSALRDMPGSDWQPIGTAPDLERVLVAGWFPRQGTVQGYWWWHEDVTDEGKAVEHPTATHWCPVVKPDFPEPPK